MFLNEKKFGTKTGTLGTKSRKASPRVQKSLENPMAGLMDVASL